MLLVCLVKFCYLGRMDAPILDFVFDELERRRGTWVDVAKAMDPDSWKSYYSWLTKLAQRKIPDPSVNKIQALADYFRGIERSAA